ncbi:MAG: class I SAM-dependent methyltransferase [Candidatus Polarisedimenticolia bacterium]
MRRFYESDGFRKRHDPRHAGNRYLFERRSRAILHALRDAGGLGAGTAYLEVGCERGAVMHVVEEAFGAADRVFGVDLMQDWLADGRRARPGLRLACADASRLPFADGAFDVVGQYMMLSSVTDREKRRAIGRELLRVVRPRGTIVSMDLRYPRVSPVGSVGVTRIELGSIFPGASIRYRTSGLLPPLARLLAPLSSRACDLLARLTILRAYHVASIRRLS